MRQVRVRPVTTGVSHRGTHRAEAPRRRPLRRGMDLIDYPLLNKGTALTEAERDASGLYGPIPPASIRSTGATHARSTHGGLLRGRTGE